MQELHKLLNFEILTPNGWENFEGIRRQLSDKRCSILLCDGKTITVTLDHRFFNGVDFFEARTAKPRTKILVKTGLTKIVSCKLIESADFVYDILETDSNIYYTDDIISHNCEFTGTSGTLISGKAMKELAYSHPIKTMNEGKMSIFVDPEVGHQYAMTVDGSEGLGLDYSTFSIFDLTSIPYQQVATFRSNTISPTFFPDVVAKSGRAYNNAMILIELNSTGKQVADYLAYDYGYDNIAWVGTSTRKGQILFGGDPEQQQPGVKTSSTTKRIGCTTLKDLIENKKILINDFHSISELSTFVRKNATTGYAADDMSNDDMVATLWLFAWLVSQEYFKALCNADVMKELHAERQKVWDNEVIPFSGTHSLSTEAPTIVEGGVVWTLMSEVNFIP